MCFGHRNIFQLVIEEFACVLRPFPPSVCLFFSPYKNGRGVEKKKDTPTYGKSTRKRAILASRHRPPSSNPTIRKFTTEPRTRMISMFNLPLKSSRKISSRPASYSDDNTSPLYGLLTRLADSGSQCGAILSHIVQFQNYLGFVITSAISRTVNEIVQSNIFQVFFHTTWKRRRIAKSSSNDWKQNKERKEYFGCNISATGKDGNNDWGC